VRGEGRDGPAADRARVLVPVTTATLAACFDSFEAATEASYAIGRAGVVPALAELIDGPVPHAVDPALGGAAGGGVGRGGGGRPAAGARGHHRGDDRGSGRGGFPARGPAPRPARAEKQGRPLIEDIAVPRSRLAEAVREIRAISARHGVPVYTLAHAADGNLHPIIVVDSSPDRLPDAAWKATGEIFALALRLGGTLTGEHGVGVGKRQWVADALGPTAHALQRRLKQAFDPRGCLCVCQGVRAGGRVRRSSASMTFQT
jgi:glycolate oxidase